MGAKLIGVGKAFDWNIFPLVRSASAPFHVMHTAVTKFKKFEAAFDTALDFYANKAVVCSIFNSFSNFDKCQQ